MATGHSQGRGLPLDDAAWRYGPAALRRAYNEPEVGEGWANLIASKRESGPLDAFNEAIAPIAPMLDKWKSRNQALIDLRELLLRKLRDGVITAIGYPAHLPSAHELVPIEPFLFQTQYTDWGKSQFIGQGRRYELVQVFKPLAEPARSAAPAPIPVEAWERPAIMADLPKPATRPVGRPNVRDKVAEIALEIVDNPMSPLWKFKSDLWPRIRAIGKIRYPEDFDEYRPREQTMRNGINDAFDKRPHLRKDHKL